MSIARQLQPILLRFLLRKLLEYKRKPLLYELVSGTGAGGGIGETKNIVERHPDVLDRIRKYLAAHNIHTKHVIVPAKAER